MVDFTKPEQLRARFAELAETRDGILAASTPKREQRDTIVRDAAAAAATIDAEIRDIEASLFDIDQEAAMIARALGGRTG